MNQTQVMILNVTHCSCGLRDIFYPGLFFVLRMFRFHTH